MKSHPVQITTLSTIATVQMFQVDSGLRTLKRGPLVLNARHRGTCHGSIDQLPATNNVAGLYAPLNGQLRFVPACALRASRPDLSAITL